MLGVLAVVGGIYTLKRHNWGMSLAGAVCAIFLPGWLPGILATVFLATSRSEFNRAGGAQAAD